MNQEDWEKKRDVIRHYDELAGIYESLYGDEQSVKIEAALQALKITGSDFVLDVGCGTGLLFNHIRDSISLLVGVDISGRILKVAADRSKNLEVKTHVSLIRADADHLPFRGGVFDKVFALTVLQNMPDPTAAFQEIAKVAKDGSEIAITGLKKSFPEESLMDILSRPGLEFFIIRTPPDARDLVAVARKARKAKDK